jgi:hypothetical protein
VSDELGVPSDNTTLTAVINGYDEAGFTGQFEVSSETAVRCDTCGEDTSPNEYDVDSRRRLEGASDPDDMLSVFALTCPRCGARGTIVLGFGPNASPTEAIVSKALGEHPKMD